MRHAAMRTRPSRLGRIILRRTFETKHAQHQKPRPHLLFPRKDENGQDVPPPLN
jgi:hypothetical protein